MPEPATAEPDDLDAAVDAAITEHGDARAAVRALLIACRYLEAARDRALDLVSYGYARGKLSDMD